jgi:hypothetical protein
VRGFGRAKPRHDGASGRRASGQEVTEIGYDVDVVLAPDRVVIERRRCWSGGTGSVSDASRPHLAAPRLSMRTGPRSIRCRIGSARAAEVARPPTAHDVGDRWQLTAGVEIEAAVEA